MKKALLVLLTLILLQIPSFAINKKMYPSTSGGENDLPNIFIYTIPDDNDTLKPQPDEDKDADENDYININNDASDENEEIMLNIEDDDNSVIGATTLKGYAEYVEDSSVIYLKDENDNFVLNIRVPQKISPEKSLDFSKINSASTSSRYKNSEYLIEPQSIKSSGKAGNFTFGALYKNEVDNIAMLESETGLFTKYEKSRFALSSSVKKSLNTTYAQDYNTISITPELKLNSYFSLKNNLSADITRNRRSSELIFSLNPFGKKDSDRMLLEAGAKQTYFADTGENKTQFNFSAKFKL